jgi:hypothetical protein
MKWRHRTPARNGILPKNVRFGGSNLALARPIHVTLF